MHSPVFFMYKFIFSTLPSPSRQMMSAGSTKSWRKIIRPLTIRNIEKISATAFLEYFEPLNTWITEDNIEKNLSVGWTYGDSMCPSDSSDKANI